MSFWSVFMCLKYSSNFETTPVYLLFLFIFFLLPFLVLTMGSVPPHRTVQTDKGRHCLLDLSTAYSAIHMATNIIICQALITGVKGRLFSFVSRFTNKFSQCLCISYQMRASPSLLVNTSISWIERKKSVEVPKLLCECVLLNFSRDLFQLVKFCYSALHLHLKHFRSLEERKKQHKEGLYLSDTLPRKKTTPSISPHFSNATLGRSTAPKVGHGENHGLHIQGVFLSCWLMCKGL